MLEQLRTEMSDFTAGEKDILQHCVERILKIAQSSRTEPLTLLLPQDEAFVNVGVDPESDAPLERKDRILGLMVDQLIMGLIPGRESPDVITREFMTLGGAPVTFSNSTGVPVLTDGFGREVRVGDPIVETPKITCRPADNILMWDEWGWV
jgi:hypothetical protein